MKFLLFLVLCLTVAFSAGAGGKKCPGHFSPPVANLCSSHFPDAQSEKIWLVKFYAPWCGHCNAMKGKYSDLAKQLKDQKEIGIGAVDCTANENQALCQKHGVKGYPTIKAFVNGKAKAYNQARETEPMKQFMLNLLKTKGTSGGSAKCQKGLFKSGVTDAVTPLCSKHFPDNNSKNSWIVAFYNQTDKNIRAKLNDLAKDFGNNAPEKVVPKKSQVTQKEKLEAIASKYDLSLNLRPKGHMGSQPIIKVGGVCCDCDEESTKFCESKNLKGMPTYQWVSKGKVQDISSDIVNEEGGLHKLSLKNLGLISKKEEL